MSIQQNDAPPRVYQGMRINSAEELQALPVQTSLIRGENHRYAYQKNGADRWYNQNTGAETDTARMFEECQNRTYFVDWIPAPVAETAKQFAARWRDTAFSGEEQSFGQNRYTADAIPDLIARFGPEFEFDPTPGMRLHSDTERDLLPEGSRVYVGVPEEPDSFGLFEKRGGRWRHLIGKKGSPDKPVVVDAVGGEVVKTEPDPWFTATPTREESERTAEARKAAWIRGMEERDRHGWCGTYNSLVKRVGLDENILSGALPDGITIGMTLTAEQAFTLPVGFTLYAANTKHGYGVFKRTASARNRAGTKLVGGNWSGKNYADEFVLAMQNNRAGVNYVDGFLQVGLVPVFNTEILDVLPTGTIIRSYQMGSGGPTDAYIRTDTASGRPWSPYNMRTGGHSGGSYESAAFRTDTPRFGIERFGA